MRDIKYVVIHHSATARDQTLENSVQSFNNSHKQRLHPEKNSLWFHIAYHYVIAWDGRRAKTRWLDEIWYHASNWEVNEQSVWICLTGNFDIEHLSKYQLEAFQYLRWELEKKLWPLEIKFHNEFAAKSCPGKNVDKSMFEKVEAPVEETPEITIPESIEPGIYEWELKSTHNDKKIHITMKVKVS
jgi:hypothetical protein